MAKRFRFSSYWRTWSLVLTDRCKAKPGYGPTVEIDLSPVNGWDCGATCNSDATRAINLRRHCTEIDARDIMTDVLPETIKSDLYRELGRDLTDWLLDPKTEILGIIDWARHNEISNGGASLRACVKAQFADRIPALRQTSEPRALAA